MGQLSQTARQILDIIAAGESHSYKDLYGGSHFEDFTQHPNIKKDLGNGMHTTAAGRYQMLKPTWDAQAKRLGLKDFTPESQDLAAWDLAERTYRQVTGRSLETDAAQNQVAWSALLNQWPSLERMTEGATMPKFQAGQSYPSNKLAPATLAPAAELEPVDYDPFQESLLIPVDHDPFGGT